MNNQSDFADISCGHAFFNNSKSSIEYSWLHKPLKKFLPTSEANSVYRISVSKSPRSLRVILERDICTTLSCFYCEIARKSKITLLLSDISQWVFCDNWGMFYLTKILFWDGSMVLCSPHILLTPSTFIRVWTNASNPVCVCREKNKRRRSDRSRYIRTNNQMIIYSRVGRSQTYQNLMVFFFLRDDVLNWNQSCQKNESYCHHLEKQLFSTHCWFKYQLLATIRY